MMMRRTKGDTRTSAGIVVVVLTLNVQSNRSCFSNALER